MSSVNKLDVRVVQTRDLKRVDFFQPDPNRKFRTSTRPDPNPKLFLADPNRPDPNQPEKICILLLACKKCKKMQKLFKKCKNYY